MDFALHTELNDWATDLVLAREDVVVEGREIYPGGRVVPFRKVESRLKATITAREIFGGPEDWGTLYEYKLPDGRVYSDFIKHVGVLCDTDGFVRFRALQDAQGQEVRESCWSPAEIASVLGNDGTLLR